MGILKKIKSGITKAKKSADKIGHWVGFAQQVRPSKDFNENKLPSPPNYSSKKSWAAHPEIDDKSSFVPLGLEKTKVEDLKADVFFIHPTTYFGNKNWNASLSHPVANTIVDEIIMSGQASVFNSCCRIFAPRYRQATFHSFLTSRDSGVKALDVAYSDVARAFDFFINHLNDGRPFFIASHSQGTVHAMRLLEDKIDNTDLVKRMVAAYTIGFEFPRVKFEEDLKNIKPSQNATDTQCVIAYDTYIEGGRPLTILDRTKLPFAHRDPETGKKDGTWEWKSRSKFVTFSTNPISWKSDNELADASQHLGAVNNEYSESNFKLESLLDKEIAEIKTARLSSVYENEVSARCGEDGILYISKPVHRQFRMMLLPGGNYHNYDYSLFYMNLRENAKARLEAFLEKHE